MSEEENDDHDVIFLVSFFVLLSTVIIHFIYRRFEHVPEFALFSTYFPQASANICWGILFGGILRLGHEVDDVFSFSPSFFFDFLLPPIIFSAGFLLRKDIFFHNLASIGVYAFVGTALAAFFTGGMVYIGGEYWGFDYDLSFVDSMMFGSLISAVDPVATIAVLEKVCLDPQLFLLIFGEAVLNDAVAVVFFEEFKELSESEQSTISAMPKAMGMIIVVALGSTFVGVISGWLQAWLHKILDLHKYHEVEIFFFIVSALAPYYIAESIHCSGIMAALFCGIMSDQYTYYHLSDSSKITLSNFFFTTSHFCESFVFVYLGMALFVEESEDYNSSLIFMTLGCCLVGRAISVGVLSFFLNLGRKHPISWVYQVTMWFAGLRGPVAFALSLMVPENTSREREKIVCATLIVVFVTTVVLGGATSSILQFLGIAKSRVYEMDDADSQNHIVQQEAPVDNYLATNHWFNRLDKNYFRRWFGNLKEDVDWDHHETLLAFEEVLPSMRAEASLRDQSSLRGGGHIGGKGAPLDFDRIELQHRADSIPLPDEDDHHPAFDLSP